MAGSARHAGGLKLRSHGIPGQQDDARAATTELEVAVDEFSGWIGVGARRRLFLPQGSNGLQEYCLRFFLSQGWQRMLMRGTLASSRLLGLPQISTRSELQQELAHHAEAMSACRGLCRDGALEIAFKRGSPGPYQKISALAVSAISEDRIFLKYAVKNTADKTVNWEASWLSRLAVTDALRGQVPELLDSGRLPCGRAYLMTSVSPTLETVPRFSRQHEQFLVELGRATSDWRRYGASDEAQRLPAMLRDLGEVLGPVVHADLVGGWNDALSVLAGWEGPLVVAHRDFAPWNVRWSPQGVFVFDWEYAIQQANPLHDFYHFHLVRKALSKWKRVSPGDLSRLMSAAHDYAHRAYPEALWDERVVSALLLTYLLDVVLFYTDSGRLFDPKHPVLATYWALIRSRKRWLPK